MTVAQFIEWLKTQDQGATVQVAIGKHGRDWQGDYVCIEDFDINNSDHANYIDFRGNQFTKEHEKHYNRRFLEIGSAP